MNYPGILKLCGGVEFTEKLTERGRYTHTEYFKTGDIVVPNNIWIEIVNTATKGTIGKLIKIEVKMRPKTENTIAQYDGTYIIKIDGRDKPSRINCYSARIHVDYKGQTKFVRNIKTKVKDVTKPVTKFGQELNRGDWIVGSANHGLLSFGRVTRWTPHTVWATTATKDEELDDKAFEFKMDSIKEIYLLPDDQHVPVLTFARLKGWNGR